MRKKRSDNLKPDATLEAAIQAAVSKDIPLSRICERAGVNQATLWKWRNLKTSPVMSVRQDVLDAITALITEHDMPQDQ